jgi:hypothetical protein
MNRFGRITLLPLPLEVERLASSPEALAVLHFGDGVVLKEGDSLITEETVTYDRRGYIIGVAFGKVYVDRLDRPPRLVSFEGEARGA